MWKLLEKKTEDQLLFVMPNCWLLLVLCWTTLILQICISMLLLLVVWTSLSTCFAMWTSLSTIYICLVKCC
jgi:hypothetical protein